MEDARDWRSCSAMTRHGGLAGIEGMDGFIYYAKTPRSPTSVWRVPVSGGGEETVVVDGLSYSTNFAVGGTGLYFMSRGGPANDTAIEHFDLDLATANPARRGRQAVVVRHGAEP